jgi:hypothetical protein
MWIVRCRVSGGVTGTREAVLKANDVVLRFATREAAAAKAREMDQKTNGNPHRVADFRYWPEEE